MWEFFVTTKLEARWWPHGPVIADVWTRFSRLKEPDGAINVWVPFNGSSTVKPPSELLSQRSFQNKPIYEEKFNEAKQR